MFFSFERSIVGLLKGFWLEALIITDPLCKDRMDSQPEVADLALDNSGSLKALLLYYILTDKENKYERKFEG